MKMYIPELGDRIVLTKDWSFQLFNEHRNSGLINLLGVKFKGDYYVYNGKQYFHASKTENGCCIFGVESKDGDFKKWNRYDVINGRVPGVTFVKETGIEVSLKAGQVLTVDRIYVRKGASDFSSITFNYIGAPKGSGRVRFWAKLADVNTIEFDLAK